MTCRELAEFILDYLEGDLEAGVRERFDRHLTLCANCVRYLDAYKATVALGRRAFEDDEQSAAQAGVPESLINAILATRPR